MLVNYKWNFKKIILKISRIKLAFCLLESVAEPNEMDIVLKCIFRCDVACVGGGIRAKAKLCRGRYRQLCRLGAMR